VGPRLAQSGDEDNSASLFQLHMLDIVNRVI